VRFGKMKNLAEQMPEETVELASKWEAWSKDAINRPIPSE
jgi:hypothetical protein